MKAWSQIFFYTISALAILDLVLIAAGGLNGAPQHILSRHVLSDIVSLSLSYWYLYHHKLNISSKS